MGWERRGGDLEEAQKRAALAKNGSRRKQRLPREPGKEAFTSATASWLHPQTLRSLPLLLARALGLGRPQPR